MSKPAAVWDAETQEVHGGQTWRSLGHRLVSDFSVTTNAFGAPEAALAAASEALAHVHHYPAADCADAIAAVADLTSWPTGQLLLGNGASEFIDLVMRAGPPGAFRPGPYAAAYMEYNRAAKAAGREVIPPDAPGAAAAVTVIIHPNSPTGHVMTLDGIEAVVKGTKGIVVIDESFILFHGPEWRSHSALNLVDKYPDQLLVLASWTKLWACPGLRLGSIAASAKWTRTLKRLQTPWSCSTPAQAFFVSAARDKEYLQKTWTVLPGWKDAMHTAVRALGWTVNEESPLWVPWVYLDCGSEEVAASAADVAHEAGCPVRLCATFGTPTCIRLGVREPKAQNALFAAWAAKFGSTAISNGSAVMEPVDTPVAAAV
jgi:histidinol-phosphate/aromatic aminotransferase/cobyric acid decarboxylase-like protein